MSMTEEQQRMRLRKFIVDMKGPFCLLNLYIRAENQLKITDQRMIDDVLNELYELGIVVYREVTRPRRIRMTPNGHIISPRADRIPPRYGGIFSYLLI